jgi:hypothetical protein
MIIEVKYDPLGAYPNASEKELLDACGILSNWAAAGVGYGGIKEALLANYAYYSGDLGGKIDEDGKYISEFKEDEDLKPYVSIYAFGLPDEICYIYPYGIVGVVKNGESWASRFD